MYNEIVFLVTPLHIVMYVSKFLRMKPLVNQNKKIHVEKVWEKQGKVHLWISRIVDDYNY